MTSCCEKGLPSSNTAQPGDIYQCVRCGRAWEHDCDEAEGCAWFEIDYVVTVCAGCLRASCWHGEGYCENALTAGIVPQSASKLRKRNAEHFDNFTLAKVQQVSGSKPRIRAMEVQR